MSENNGDYNVYADTDGKTVAWVDHASKGILLKTLGGAGGDVSALAVDGDYVVYTVTDPTTGLAHVGYVQMSTGKTALVDGGRTPWSAALPSVRDGKIAYATMWPESTGYKLGVEVLDAATGETTLMPIDKNTTMRVGQPPSPTTADRGRRSHRLGPGRGAPRGARRLGPGHRHPGVRLPVRVLTDGLGRGRLGYDDAVGHVVGQRHAAEAVSGSPLRQGSVRWISCNRGDQVYAAADEGLRVLWLDGTAGSTNLVKRDRPAGGC